MIGASAAAPPRRRPPDVTGCTGYRVEAPEGDLGRVERVEVGGVPPRPLVVAVRALGELRLVPVARVAQVKHDERRLLLWPDPSSRGPRRQGAGP